MGLLNPRPEPRVRPGSQLQYDTRFAHERFSCTQWRVGIVASSMSKIGTPSRPRERRLRCTPLQRDGHAFPAAPFVRKGQPGRRERSAGWSAGRRPEPRSRVLDYGQLEEDITRRMTRTCPRTDHLRPPAHGAHAPMWRESVTTEAPQTPMKITGPQQKRSAHDGRSELTHHLSSLKLQNPRSDLLFRH